MPIQASIERRKQRREKQNKQPKIGHVRSDGKVYSGANYGYQTKATHQKLKEAGKFRAGTQALDRATSSAKRALKKITPEPVKRAARAYGRRFAEAQQREQADLDAFARSGTIGKTYVEAKRGADNRRANDIEWISKKLNLDPRIVSTAITAVETAAEGRLSKQQLTAGVRNYVRQLPADTAEAMGRKVIRRQAPDGNPPRSRPFQQPQPADLPQGRYPGGSADALKRDTEVRAGIQQTVRDIRAGKRKSAQSSVNKARDPQGTERAAASVEASNETLTRQLRAQKRKGAKPTRPRTGVTGGSKSKREAPALTKEQQELKSRNLRQQARLDKAKQAIRARLAVEKNNPPLTPSERAALRQYSNNPSGQTHPTFSSKKGGDVRTYSAADLYGGGGDYKGDRFVDQTGVGRTTSGVQYFDAGRTGRQAGRPGAARALRQQQNRNIAKVKRSNGSVDVRPELTEDAIRDRIGKYIDERNNPKQFNQLEARDRGGEELPQRVRSVGQKPGAKGTDRDKVLGKAGKSPKTAKRTDNVPGGREIKPTKVEQKRRQELEQRRARAKRMRRGLPAAKEGQRSSMSATQRRDFEQQESDRLFRANRAASRTRRETPFRGERRDQGVGGVIARAGGSTKPVRRSGSDNRGTSGAVAPQRRNNPAEKGTARSQATRQYEQRRKSEVDVVREPSSDPRAVNRTRRRTTTYERQDGRTTQKPNRGKSTGLKAAEPGAKSIRATKLITPSERRGLKSANRNQQAAAIRKVADRVEATDPAAAKRIRAMAKDGISSQEAKRIVLEVERAERIGSGNPNVFMPSGEMRNRPNLDRDTRLGVDKRKVKAKPSTKGSPKSPARSAKQREAAQELRDNTRARRRSGTSNFQRDANPQMESIRQARAKRRKR